MTEIEDYFKSFNGTVAKVSRQLAGIDTQFLKAIAGVQRDYEKALAPLIEASARAAKVARSISIPNHDFSTFALPQFELPTIPRPDHLVGLDKLFK